MGRQPCCDKVGLRRGPWTIDEDNKLICFILNNGIQCWRTVPKLAGLLRCGKSCRLRWINYLRPDLKRGDFTETEENQIIQLHSRLGNRWSKIASYFSGRTDNEIKNHWNTKLKKKLKSLGVDPLTHKPILQVHKSISANTTVVLEPIVGILGDKASSIEECLETSEEDVKVSDGIGTICSAGVTDMLYETDSISGLILNVGFDQDTHYNNSSQDCSLWMELDALSNKYSGSVREIRSINKDSNNHCSPMLCWDSLRVQDDFFNF